jgi:hypothetical protein
MGHLLPQMMVPSMVSFHVVNHHGIVMGEENTLENDTNMNTAYQYLKWRQLSHYFRQWLIRI